MPAMSPDLVGDRVEKIPVSPGAPWLTNRMF